MVALKDQVLRGSSTCIFKRLRRHREGLYIVKQSDSSTGTLQASVNNQTAFMVRVNKIFTK